MLLSERAQFDLARRLRQPEGIDLGEAFSFLSGLYFRGKLAYASAFASPPRGLAGAYVITSNRGLLPVGTRITLTELRAFGKVAIDCDDPRYRIPLEIEARKLRRASENCQIILLGSVATGKYVDVLLDIVGPQLHFPVEFVGRGDMSRGGLMLRCVDVGRELSYVPVKDAIRRGSRPPKLARRMMRRGGTGNTERSHDLFVRHQSSSISKA